MGEGCDIENIPHELRFMISKISAPNQPLIYWLNVPEFADEMLTMVGRRETIDDLVVYEVMSRIYAEKKMERQTSGRRIDFNFRFANNAIKKLRRSLGLLE